MTPRIIAAITLLLAPCSVMAQSLATEQTIPATSPVSFSADSNGYGSGLINTLMPGRLGDWKKDNVDTSVVVAPLQIDDSGQDAYAVRIENAEMCDASGCLTFVFRHSESEWKPVFQVKTSGMGVSAVDPSSHMATIVTSDGSVWIWDGRRFDVSG